MKTLIYHECYLFLCDLVPHGVDTHVGCEQGQTAGQTLDACEATLRRPREHRAPQVVVNEVLGSLSPQHLVKHKQHQ